MKLSKSIYGKCVLTVTIIVTVLTVVFATFTYQQEKRRLVDIRENELDNLVERLSVNLPSLMWNFELKQLEIVLGSEVKINAVSDITIYDIDGNVLVTKGGGERQKSGSIEVEMLHGGTELVGNAVITTNNKAISEALDSLLISVFIQGVILLTILIGIFQLVFSKLVSTPLNNMLEAFRNISGEHGDLTQRLKITSDDELGELAAEFNGFVGTIQNLIDAIHDAVIENTALAGQFSEDAESSNQLLNSQQSEIDLIATAITEMSQSASEIVKHAGETVKSTNEVNTDTSEVSQIVTSSIGSIVDLTTELDGAANSIANLENQVQNIHGVLDVIVSIAEQTNLLALNAAIEAARAGEQGRGFAVVADEVRALASRTKNSTAEIHRTIESLQAGTRETVTAIQNCQKKSCSSSTYASSSASSIDRIKDATENIKNMSSEIEVAVSEQSSVSNSLTENVNCILLTGTQSIERLSTLLSRINLLNQSTKKLNTLVNRFNF